MNKDRENRPSGNFDETDEFSRMYEEQLNKFSAMDGKTYDDTLEYSDLEFHDVNEQYGGSNENHRQYNPNPQSGNPNGSRTQNYSQRRGQTSRSRNENNMANNQRQRPAGNNRRPQQRAKTNKNLQFGSNNMNNRSYDQQTISNLDNSYTPVYDSVNDVRANKNKKKKKSPVKRFFKWMFIILLVMLILIEAFIFKFVNSVNVVDTGKRTVTNASMYDSSVLNILVIGSDARSLEERGRTDSMILLSVNKKTDEITMTSFMRDMYVEIPDNGWDKLNAANVYGGPELLMDTIEYNFDVRVDKYVYIDFYSFVDIVDAIGGIELDISDEEAEGMKAPMAEQNKIMKKEKGSDYLEKGGKMLANGNQALAYSRLRYVGNADFERTERQRTVISKIMDSAITFNPFKLNRIASAGASHITTNMSKLEMQLLANRLPFLLSYETKELRIPEDDMYYYGSHDGQSTLDVDFDACRQSIRDNIYG